MPAWMNAPVHGTRCRGESGLILRQVHPPNGSEHGEPDCRDANTTGMRSCRESEYVAAMGEVGLLVSQPSPCGVHGQRCASACGDPCIRLGKLMCRSFAPRLSSTSTRDRSRTCSWCSGHGSSSWPPWGEECGGRMGVWRWRRSLPLSCPHPGRVKSLSLPDQ